MVERIYAVYINGELWRAYAREATAKAQRTRLLNQDKYYQQYYERVGLVHFPKLIAVVPFVRES